MTVGVATVIVGVEIVIVGVEIVIVGVAALVVGVAALVVAVATLVVAVARVFVTGGLVGVPVVVVADGGGVGPLVEAPPVVVVGTVLCADATVVGGLVVVATVAGRTVGVVELVAPFATVLRDAVLGSGPGIANVTMVDRGEVAVNAPDDGECGAAVAADVGVGPSGVARSACTGASVGPCE